MWEREKEREREIERERKKERERERKREREKGREKETLRRKHTLVTETKRWTRKGLHENMTRNYDKKRLPSIKLHKSEQLIEILRI